MSPISHPAPSGIGFRPRWRLTRLGAAAVIVAPLLVVMGGLAVVPAGRPPLSLPRTLDEHAALALEKEGHGSVAALRAAGQAGVDALAAAHQERLTRLLDGEYAAPDGADPRLFVLREVFDAVTGQRDGYASRLYWHEDLDAALADARRTGRPVLSLRMLGRLDEELSCANSRFFRVLLYADPLVAQAMREGFVLHWSSERPVPQVTIDMGDGRVIRETITGNSAHYVLNADGKIVDFLPGLVDAEAFRAFLSAARERHDRCRGAADEATCVRDAHRRELESLETAFEARYGRARLPAQVLTQTPRRWPDGIGDLPAAAAAGLALSKSAIERPRLEALSTSFRDRFAELTPEARDLLTRTPPKDPPLQVLRLIGRKLPPPDEDGLFPLYSIALQNLHRTVAEDALVNLFELRPRVTSWLAQEGPAPFAPFNERVYRQVFRTPPEDAWLGLRNTGVFTALEGDGIRGARRAR